jgi:hypothetical protein
MKETKQSTSWYVDLVGIFLSASAISYLSYLGLRDSVTGEIKNMKVLAASLILHFGSYLLSYLLFFKRNDFLKIPNWALIAFVGSILCSITFRLPVNMIDIDSIAVLAFFFSLFSLGVMGFVRLIYWMAKRKVIDTGGV